MAPDRLARLATVVAPFVLVAGAAGCGDDETDAAAADQACSQLAEARTALDSLRDAVGEQGTVGEVREAREALEEAREGLDDAVGEVEQDRVDRFEEAWEQLDAAVDDVDDDQTLREAATSIEDELGAVVQARDELTTAIECPA